MEFKPIKLSPKRNGAGYISSYTINLGSAEINKCGFLSDTGEPMDIEKVIDLENKQIILRLKSK